MTYPYDNSPEWTLHFQLFPSEYDQAGSDDDVIGGSFHGAKANILTVTVTERELFNAAPLYDERGGPWYNTSKVDILAGFGSICYEKIVFISHIMAPRWATLKWFKIGEGPTHYTLYWNLMAFGPGGSFGITGFMPPCTLPSVGYNMTLGLVPDPVTGLFVRRVIPKGPLPGAPDDSDVTAYATQVQCKGSNTSVPYGNYQVICYLWITPAAPNPDDNDGPEPIRVWHLIHDTITRATVTPAHNTALLDGGEVLITATPAASCTLSSFTVDGSDCLARNPFLKEDVSADVHVSAVGNYGTITKQAGDVVSETLTLQVCANCGPVTWSADFGTLTGLTIGAATGLISGTIPYGTTPGTYPVIVTAVNNGRSASRTFNIIVTLPPVYGTTWAALARVGVAGAAVTSLFQTSTGRVLVGVGNAALGSSIYYSDDLSTFTDFDPTGAVLPKRSQTITSFHQGASGRIFATTDITGARPMLLYSDDNGTNWTVALNANGTTNAGDLVLFGASTIMIPAITSLGRLRVLWSTDNGTTWAAPNYFEYNPGPVLLSGRMLTTSDSKIVTSMTGITVGSYIIKHNTTNDGAVYTDAVSGAVRGNPTKDSANKILMPLQTLLLDGGVDGSAFTTRYTAAGNIGVAKYLAQGVGLLGLNGGTVSVLRSTDDMNTFGATAGTLDGTLCYCMCFLADGSILFGTNGATTNLFRSAS